MSFRGDDIPEMGNSLEPDERDLTALLRGHRPANRPDLEPLAALVDDLRHTVSASARPNVALAALLAAGLPPAPLLPAPARRAHRAAAAVRWATSLRTAAKAGVLATVAALGIASAATAGALPDSVQDKLSTAVETVTPWHIPRPAGHGIGDLVREKNRNKDKKNKGVDTDSGSPTPTASPGQNAKPAHSEMSEHQESSDAGRDGKVKSSTPESTPASERTHTGDPARPSRSEHPAKDSKKGEPGGKGGGHGGTRPDPVPALHPEPGPRK